MSIQSAAITPGKRERRLGRQGWPIVVAVGCVVMTAQFAHGQARKPRPATSRPADSPPEIATKIEDLKIRHRTEHYALAGTVPQKKLEEHGRALEFIHKEYVKGFDKLLKEEKKAAGAGKRGARTTARPSDGSKPGKPKKKDAAESDDDKTEDAGNDEKDGDKDRFRVIVFNNDKEYQSFGRAYLSGNTEHSDGMFVPSLKTLLITDKKEADDTYSLLFHEAFHQFAHRHIADTPMWLNEGLATYYGAAKPTARGLDWSNPPRGFWQICRQAIQFKAHIPVYEVTRANYTQFYDTTPVKLPGMGDQLIRRSLFYSESYTLIHVLVKDRGGLTKLQNYIRDLAADDGTNTKRITDRHFDERACKQLEQAWIRYVKARKDRPVVRRP